MQQLTRMDAVFLSMETPETPAHIGGLAILDPSTAPDGFDFDRFVDFLESRIKVCPRFMWTVQEVPFGLDRPYWVEGGGRTPREQVHRVAVPSPGGREELADLVGLLFERPLDRTLPLWEMFFIEGLQGGRVAVLWKVHHCLLDGRSGAGIAEIMFDLSPQPADRPLIAPDDEAHAGEPASWSELARSAVRNGIDLPGASLRHAGKAVSMAIDGHFGPLSELSSTLAPKTSFNGRVGAKRCVAWSTASLADAKAVKETLGVKLNDVILGITAEAIRGYLIGRDELPEQSLIAGVPVSTRQGGDQAPGNQITAVNVYWGTDVEDPIHRIHAIHAAADEAKRSVETHRNLDPMAILADAFLPGALQLFARG
ncbi:wax ester/triacylglycerol synthase family O-acyltransferase, partial [Myxococcota bacterium]|nr:wax ester/triacylglycerol synthase family O-acyltransferase [Myxococcota bacterium]